MHFFRVDYFNKRIAVFFKYKFYIRLTQIIYIALPLQFMYSIFQKEIKSFFSSIVGYVVIIVFLLVGGLFMWVLPDTNLLDYGYASLEKFFDFAPWLLLFLIPAITMRMFPDELRNGTLEILQTKPLTDFDIVLGKYFATLMLVLLACIPTVLYIFSLRSLASQGHTLDYGGIAGSYCGLLFLAAGFAAIGMLCSAFTNNQIVGFLVAVFGCYIFYAGFEAFSTLPVFKGNADYYLSQIGMQFHYKNISRGLIDTRDVIYFLSIALLFILGTVALLRSRNWEK
jgi:ABC-2 type transport system permease protein